MKFKYFTIIKFKYNLQVFKLNKFIILCLKNQKFSRMYFLKISFFFFKLIKKYNIFYFQKNTIFFNTFFKMLKNLKFILLFQNVSNSINYFFFKSKSILNLQLLLFQNRKIICTLTFLLNNTIGCIMDAETHFVYYIKSTSLLGFKGSSSKSRYAISMLLNDCFSKLVSLNLRNSLIFKLIFNSFVNIQYLYYIISRFIIFNFGKKFYLKKKYINKNNVIFKNRFLFNISKSFEASFNFLNYKYNFYSKKKYILRKKFKKFIMRYFFFNYFSFFIKYLISNLVINNFNNINYSWYFNSCFFFEFLKNYRFKYLFLRNDLKLIKFNFFILQFFNYNIFKNKKMLFKNLNDFFIFKNIKETIFSVNLYKKTHKVVFIKRSKRNNLFSRYFFKLKLIYIVKSYAFNGCRLSKLRRKRVYHHFFYRNSTNFLLNYIVKRRICLKGI